MPGLPPLKLPLGSCAKLYHLPGRGEVIQFPAGELHGLRDDLRRKLREVFLPVLRKALKLLRASTSLGVVQIEGGQAA